MFICDFFVKGTPKAQPRVRAARRGTHAMVYDPGTAKKWKDAVAAEAKARCPKAPLEGPVSVSFYFLFPRPRRLMYKTSPEGRIMHITKPDRDNLDKAILDVLTKVGFFKDDCQVCDGSISKQYVQKAGEEPGVRIVIHSTLDVNNH